MPAAAFNAHMALPPFQHLLDEHGREVHRLLTGMVGRTDAEDCYQETWIAALRAYPGLARADNLRAWVMTIAHRKALDHLRARKRIPIPVPEPPEPPHADELPPQDWARFGDNAVWGRVQALPPKQRTAVALRYLADAAYVEIAGAMGTTEQAARRNVHEGLKRLRTEYQEP